MHEFVHFTGEKKLQAASKVGGAKQVKGKPIDLCSNFVQFVWLTSYLLTSLFSAQIIYSVNQF